VIDERSQDQFRLRSLQGEHEGVERLIFDLDVETGSLSFDPFENLCAVRRIHDEHVELGEPVNEYVVENPPLLIRDERVTDVTDSELRNVIRHDVVEEEGRFRAGENAPERYRTVRCLSTMMFR
jgi:hypothetical protein